MSKELGLGKISNKIFEKIVLPHIPITKELELDGTSLKLEGNTVIAHSPCIGVPNETLGFFAFHYSASNVAAKFGKPKHIVTGIYLPLKTKIKVLENIAKSLGKEAKKYGVTIAAGQTATYYGLKIPLITTTCLGESLRLTRTPEIDDIIAIIGEIGGEGAWLKELNKGKNSERWKLFTPLPITLKLHTIPEVKMMHDVSEGGLIGALYEIEEKIKLKIKIDSTKMTISKEWNTSDERILRSPTYGVLIAIINPKGKEKVGEKCMELGLPCTFLEPLQKGRGLHLDDKVVDNQLRIDLDEIYGTFKHRTREK